MGLFGLFKKKTEYFDKKMEPKCAYCEHGQPGRSNKMILCTKCGIVNEDYSCKKFVYSPLKRIPDKEHPSPDPTLVGKQTEEAKPQEKSAVPAPTVEVKTQENPVTPAPTVEVTTQEKPVIPAPTVEVKTQEKPVTPAPTVEVKTQEKTVAPAPTVEVKTQEKTVAPAPTVEVKTQEAAPISAISEIHNTPQGNEENIKKLESSPKVQLSGIENEVAPKEIILPDVSEETVCSIANSPTERNSDAYLKTIPEQDVSGFVNNGHTVHKLPENTKIPTLSELK